MISKKERYSKWYKVSLRWAIGLGLLGNLLIILNISTSATVTYAQVVSSQTPTITPAPTLDGTQLYPGPEQTASVDQGGLDGSVTPGLVESSPQASQTALDSSQQGATATLIPFPTITIIFPNTKTVSPLILPDQVNSSAGRSGTSNLSRFWPFGLLVSAWLVLAAWFYLSHRHHD
jgi:hypothetical protein